MLKTISSKRYAQAIFEIARDKNELDIWKTDLKMVSGLMEDREFAALVENPKMQFDFKAKLAEQKLGTVRKPVINLVYLLITKDKLKYSYQILKDYELLVDEYQDIKHAEVTTATPASETERKAITSKLETLLGKKVTVTLQVDPFLIGGAVIKIGDSLIDGSIRSKMDMLKRELIGARH